MRSTPLPPDAIAQSKRKVERVAERARNVPVLDVVERGRGAAVGPFVDVQVLHALPRTSGDTEMQVEGEVTVVISLCGTLKGSFCRGRKSRDLGRDGWAVFRVLVVRAIWVEGDAEATEVACVVDFIRGGDSLWGHEATDGWRSGCDGSSCSCGSSGCLCVRCGAGSRDHRSSSCCCNAVGRSGRSSSGSGGNNSTGGAGNIVGSGSRGSE